MKTKLLFSIFLFISIYSNSQNVWTGNIDDLWSNADNWSGNVPDSSEDVLIPTGFTVTLDTPADIRSIEVQGNSTLNVTESLIIAVDSEFEDNVVVNWSSGDLSGPGILLNSGTINMSFSSFDIGGSAVLNNPGTINLIGSGRIGIVNNSVLNNSGTGIIDFQGSATQIVGVGSPPNAFNNFGTIKTTLPNPTDEVQISGQLINHDGIFQIDTGTLELNTSALNLNGGTFNIAAGAAVEWNGVTTILGTVSGSILGDLTWSNDVVVSPSTTAVFAFTGNQKIIWNAGDLEGGGNLVNQSLIQKNTAIGFIFNGTTLDNLGQIEMTSTGDIFIGTNSTLNNSISGVIDFQGNGSAIATSGSAPHFFNNLGVISSNQSSQGDVGTINAPLNNNNGTIQVNSGTLNFSNTSIVLNGGTYNVLAGGIFNWVSPFSIDGQLEGTLTGDLNWNNEITVSNNVTFNFSSGSVVKWNQGNLVGGGTLNNNVTIKRETVTNVFIFGSTVLNNNGLIEFSSGGDIFIGTDSVLNNNASGTIDLLNNFGGISTSGLAPNMLNNMGTLNANAASGTVVVSAQVNNSGVIDVIQNGISFSGVLTNENSGIIKGNGTLTVSSNVSNFINNGTFSPGASPGTLSFVNEYNSNPSSVLEIEINGAVQGVDYDLLTIDGDANLNGSINITLGFSPSINDEFIVLNTPGFGDTIDLCNLPATTTASFNGFVYDFDITCRNSEELVLTVTDESLSTSDNELLSINIFPNPTKGNLTINNNTIMNVLVYDINGRLMMETQNREFSIENFNKGVYFVKAENNQGQSIIRRIIKY
ncbi:MAG: T9SS C-terminal target domain-containing protein [Winogradskyella sp.]|uniref:T9SS type A sorting domain-containing protein n=1 Tax=Winogradskyella sp. TaxID=1883156 RepID=UPI000F3DC992|nr:T9SS type A sorting domain-containing protein [Winogradskyella sp.]RNC88110.1 MAG: T9SS C-terminal target domain-containing protein [Winogradskyella sp.]